MLSLCSAPEASGREGVFLQGVGDRCSVVVVGGGRWLFLLVLLADTQKLFVAFCFGLPPYEIFDTEIGHEIRQQSQGACTAAVVHPRLKRLGLELFVFISSPIQYTPNPAWERQKIHVAFIIRYIWLRLYLYIQSSPCVSCDS